MWSSPSRAPQAGNRWRSATARLPAIKLDGMALAVVEANGFDVR